MKNNAKRILSFMLAVLLCVCMIVVPAAAADVECEEHVKGEVYDTVESVCGNYGYTIYVCSVCQDYFAADLVKPTGTHTAGELVAEGVKATCTEDGVEASYKCTTCGNVCDANGGTVDVIAKGDGTHNIEGLEPVKVVDGTEYYVCADCGAEVTVVVACPEGTHVWGDAPTSITVGDKTADGVIGTATYTCTKCPVTKTVDVLWDHVHTDYLTHVEAKIPAHCEAEGNIEYWHCEFCGMNFLDADATKVAENVENNGKHSYDDEPTYIAPTCTTYGFTFYACTVCGEQDTSKTIVHKPLGHNNKDGVYLAGDEGYEATCEKDGYTGTYNCDTCGVEVKGEVIPATGHDYKTVVVEKTCSVFGYEFTYCANANCDHAAVEEVNGYDVKVADKDGNKVAVNYKPDSLKVDAEGGYNADAHTLVEVIINAPTCTEAGSKYYHCRDTAKCNYHTEPEVIPATGHNYDTTKGATIVKTHSEQSCTTGYVVDIQCADCDAVSEKVALKPALGHDTEKAELQTKLPTCKTDGKTYKVCATCKVEVTVDVLKFNFDLEKYYATTDEALKDHAGLVLDKYDETNAPLGYVVDRTGSCEIIGLYRYMCVDCAHAVLVVIDGTGNGHVADDTVTEFADGTPFKPAEKATCEKDGYTGDFFCKECKKYFEGVVVKATGHKEVEVEAKAPTCTEDGFTKGVVCEICDKVLTAQETIPALGHDWAAAEDGTYVCGRCELVCDHSAAVIADSRVANCTLYGYKHYVCECGYEYITDYVEELGHTAGEAVTTAPTCTKDGATVTSCTVCKDENGVATVIETVVIPATGHKNAAGETIVESCTDKVEDRVCVNENCDDADKVIGTDCTNTVTTFVDATCSEYGYVLVVCLDCGEYTMTIDDTKEPLTHKYTIFVETLIPATPTTKGQAVYACEHCGEDTILDVDFAGTSFDVTVENTLAAKVEADKVAGNLSEDLVIDKKVVNGSEIKVTITLNTEAIELWGLELDIRYATQYLTFKGAEIGEVFADTAVFGTTIVDNGNGWLALLATANNSADPEHGGVQNQTVEGAVVVVDLYFDVTDKAAGKNVELTFDAAAYDKDAKVVAAQTGAATIEVATLYDVTHDGAINMADLNAMMKMYTGESNVYCTAADINRNGVIDVEDIQAMMLYVLKH